jgi:hypothetical protein
MALPSRTVAPATRRRIDLPTAAALGFSLPFAAVAMALLLGYGPSDILAMGFAVDTAVIVLFVPLCVLVAAILFEVARLGVRPEQLAPARRRPSLSSWNPGSREG